MGPTPHDTEKRPMTLVSHDTEKRPMTLVSLCHMTVKSVTRH